MNYDEDTHYHALEYIRRKFYTRGEPKKELDRPFCLFVSYTQPHSPYQTIKKYWDLYQDEQISLPEVMEGYKDAEISMDKWLREYEGISDELMDNEKVLKTLRRAYYGMVSYIDEKVGELMGCLERFDLKKSTAVFFLADHGDMVAERGLIEKRTFYEYSARIPLIGCWPGMWKEGVHIKEPVSLVDILPTISDLTEVEFPFEIDGTSFLPYLEKKSGDPQESRIAIGEYLCEGVKYPCFMVRRGKYKYVYVHKHDSQLFNLEQDPHELHNLSGDEDVSEVEQELKQIILDKFDCEKIRKQIITKQKRCMYIHEAMMEGEKTMWDLKPKQETSLKYDQ